MDGRKQYRWLLLLASILFLFGIFSLTLEWIYLALPVIACGAALSHIGLQAKRKQNVSERRQDRSQLP